MPPPAPALCPETDSMSRTTWRTSVGRLSLLGLSAFTVGDSHVVRMERQLGASHGRTLQDTTTRSVIWVQSITGVELTAVQQEAGGLQVSSSSVPMRLPEQQFLFPPPRKCCCSNCI